MCWIVGLSFIIHYSFQCAQLPVVLFTRASQGLVCLFGELSVSHVHRSLTRPRPEHWNCTPAQFSVRGLLGNSCPLSWFIQWRSVLVPFSFLQIHPTTQHPVQPMTVWSAAVKTIRCLPLTVVLEQLAAFIDDPVSRGRTDDCVLFSGRQILTLRDPPLTEWPINDLGMRLKSQLSLSRILRFLFFSVWHQLYTDATCNPP